MYNIQQIVSIIYQSKPRIIIIYITRLTLQLKTIYQSYTYTYIKCICSFPFYPVMPKYSTWYSFQYLRIQPGFSWVNTLNPATAARANSFDQSRPLWVLYLARVILGLGPLNPTVAARIRYFIRISYPGGEAITFPFRSHVTCEILMYSLIQYHASNLHSSHITIYFTCNDSF